MTSLLPASLSQDSSINNHRVVTFCSSGNLDGDLVLPDICVSGFAWNTCEEPTEMPFNYGITGIEYHGQNVDVYSTEPIDFNVGEWIRGDRVYNVGTDGTWAMAIKKITK